MHHVGIASCIFSLGSSVFAWKSITERLEIHQHSWPYSSEENTMWENTYKSYSAHMYWSTTYKIWNWGSLLRKKQTRRSAGGKWILYEP